MNNVLCCSSCGERFSCQPWCESRLQREAARKQLVAEIKNDITKIKNEPEWSPYPMGKQ